MKTCVAKNVYDLDDRLSKLFSAMASYEVVDVYDLMEDIFDYLIKFKSKNEVYNNVMHITFKLQSYLIDMKEDLTSICGENFNSIDKLFKFETVEDIKKWLRMGIYKVSQHLNDKKQKRNRKQPQ